MFIHWSNLSLGLSASCDPSRGYHHHHQTPHYQHETCWWIDGAIGFYRYDFKYLPANEGDDSFCDYGVQGVFRVIRKRLPSFSATESREWWVVDMFNMSKYLTCSEHVICHELKRALRQKRFDVAKLKHWIAAYATASAKELFERCGLCVGGDSSHAGSA